jgi:protocatechuate 3,4-dioxygenase beta subunit
VTVYSVRGDILPDAKLEIWQADHLGHYDVQGYRYRTTLAPDAKGAYAFESVLPGHYPGRVCQHVHYLVHAPGHAPLVTQLYFASDPVFEGDPDHNYGRDPLIESRELIRPVVIEGDPRQVQATVRFDIVLEKA